MDANIGAAILHAYTSLQKPNFMFASERYSSRVYEPVLLNLASDGFSLVDETDLNDDVCLRVVVTRPPDRLTWHVYLSFVGKYAVVLREGRKLVFASELVSESEKRLWSILETHGFMFLDRSALEEPVAVPMFNIEDVADVKLFHVLFSDIPSLPWRAG